MSNFSWTQFFRDAGIPLPIAKRYSLSFDDNRISKDMLMDLSKEILTEMSITAMGDVINILKHAKKVHVQDVKKREKESVISTSATASAISSKRPPVPSPHSTTSGQGAVAVSTTSTSSILKKRPTKRLKKVQLPDDLDGEAEVAYIAYVEPSNEEVELETPHQKLKTGQLYSSLEATEPASLADDEDSQQSYVTSKYEANVKVDKMYSDNVQVMKQQSLQSGQQQQARVIMLPGEGRDIFTTTALQKAAKVYESGVAQEGSLATDRSRRLLESAALEFNQPDWLQQELAFQISGLIPSKVKDTGHSVFSRLDFKPSISYLSAPLSSSTPKITSLTQRSGQQRIIQLAKPSTTTLYSDQLANADVTSSVSNTNKRVISVRNASQMTALYSDQQATDVTSSVSPLKKRVISVGQNRYISVRQPPKTSTLYSDQVTSDRVTSTIPPIKKRVISLTQQPRTSRLSSSYYGRLQASTTTATTNPSRISMGNRLISDHSPPTLAGRLGTGEREIGNYSPSSLGTRRFRSMPSPSQREGVVTTVGSRTGVLGYRHEGARGGGGVRGGMKSSHVGVRGGMKSSHIGVKTPTMVADEYEYQSRRQQDIRSRLERKEREIASRRGGPLSGRLGSHKVFRRLE